MRLLHAALAAAGAMIFGSASSGADSLRLVLGTATPGGGFAVYGRALAEALGGADPGLAIEPQATGGSIENIPLLEAGKLDLALVEGTTAHAALTGIGRAQADLRIIAVMYSSPGMFVVRGDSNYRTVDDLKGQRVVFGATHSGLVVLARYVLDGLGLDLQKDFEAVLLERAADGPPLVLSSAAAALWGGGIGWPGFEVVARGPAGARFIGLQPEEIARIQARHPFLKTMSMPAGTYAGQDRTITTVGSWNVILARPGLADEVAYRVARALQRAQPAFGQRLAQAQETTAANTIAAAPRPGMLHPGVVRYFREMGLMQ